MEMYVQFVVYIDTLVFKTRELLYMETFIHIFV